MNENEKKFLEVFGKLMAETSAADTIKGKGPGKGNPAEDSLSSDDKMTMDKIEKNDVVDDGSAAQSSIAAHPTTPEDSESELDAITKATLDSIEKNDKTQSVSYPGKTIGEMMDNLMKDYALPEGQLITEGSSISDAQFNRMKAVVGMHLKKAVSTGTPGDVALANAMTDIWDNWPNDALAFVKRFKGSLGIAESDKPKSFGDTLSSILG